MLFLLKNLNMLKSIVFLSSIVLICSSCHIDVKEKNGCYVQNVDGVSMQCFASMMYPGTPYYINTKMTRASAIILIISKTKSILKKIGPLKLKRNHWSQISMSINATRNENQTVYLHEFHQDGRKIKTVRNTKSHINVKLYTINSVSWTEHCLPVKEEKKDIKFPLVTIMGVIAGIAVFSAVIMTILYFKNRNKKKVIKPLTVTTKKVENNQIYQGAGDYSEPHIIQDEAQYSSAATPSDYSAPHLLEDGAQYTIMTPPNQQPSGTQYSHMSFNKENNPNNGITSNGSNQDSVSGYEVLT